MDSREFSCLTPMYLKQRGFWVVPIQLYIGDFVLSDEICVERKSVSTGDLFESFKSGRLLEQITNMHRFYKTPVLLIEFDECMPFRLEDHTFPTDFVSGGDLSIVAIFSKLSMLAVNFPGLQILWSTGPAHTAELFHQLKQEGTDPDLHRIVRIGKVADQTDFEQASGWDCAGGPNLNEEDDDFTRFLPSEFLKRLPGVTQTNIGDIVSHVATIVELCQIADEDLRKLIGPKNSKDLLSFLEM